jgi:hypothetical protein
MFGKVAPVTVRAFAGGVVIARSRGGRSLGDGRVTTCRRSLGGQVGPSSMVTGCGGPSGGLNGRQSGFGVRCGAGDVPLINILLIAAKNNSEDLLQNFGKRHGCVGQ